MDNNAITDEQSSFIASFDMAQFAQQQAVNFAGGVDVAGMPLDGTDRHQQSVQPTDDPAQLDMDALQKMFGFVNDGDDHRAAEDAALTPKPNSSRGSQGGMVTSELINQIKLQQFNQLQQMQNQIFHHQMELLKLSQSLQAATGTSDIGPPPIHGIHYNHGLPTPVNSHNLQAQIHPDVQQAPLVSPMIPVVDGNIYGHGTPQIPTPAPSSTQTSPNIFPQGHAMSAPARLAFVNTSGMAPLPSPDYDLSPIPSPWLAPMGPSFHSLTPQAPFGDHSTRKRSNFALDDEMSSRKRHAHTSKPLNHRGQNPSPDASTPSISSSKRRRSLLSASDTPSAIAMSGGMLPTDTPSPVDLSMPPPASHPQVAGGSSPGDRSKSSSSPNPMTPDIEPVTPGSIMGMTQGERSYNHPIQTTQTSKPRAAKSKGSLKLNTATNATSSAARSPVSRTSTRRNSKGGPALKAILPDGMPPTPDMLTSVPNYNLPPLSASGSANVAGMPPRKTSHKAAEQKRRDSLKTTFDELRMLLPPIPLPTDDPHADEPLLPGSLPPRGPPKGEPDGPNRHVSKLQLLRSGNDYIRVLKGRVDRRDDEIGKLRREIRRMRLGSADGVGCVSPDDMAGIEEDIDLEKDLDEVEREMEKLKKRKPLDLDDGDDDDD